MARIALVHDVAGIAEVQAQLLRGAGHEVDQIALPVIGATWGWPTKAAALPIRLAAYLPTVMRLRRGKYDVVHVHWLTHGIVGVLARRPFFAQAHGSDLHLNLNNPVYRLVTRRVLRSPTKVFSVTPNLRTFLKEVDCKLLYLPNPVDMRGVGQPYPPPSQVSKVVVFTRLDPVKGEDRLFPAVVRLRAPGAGVEGRRVHPPRPGQGSGQNLSGGGALERQRRGHRIRMGLARARLREAIQALGQLREARAAQRHRRVPEPVRRRHRTDEAGDPQPDGDRGPGCRTASDHRDRLVALRGRSTAGDCSVWCGRDRRRDRRIAVVA